MKSVYVWTWKIKDTNGQGWVLCRFAEATKKILLDGYKPSPEAKPVRVRMNTK